MTTLGAQQKYCVGCAEIIHISAASCPKCGATFGDMVKTDTQRNSVIDRSTESKISDAIYCRGCGVQIHKSAQQCPKCGALQSIDSIHLKKKDKTTAAILAFLLGGIGVHRFYMGHSGRGLLYLVFCWTWIPMIISLVEGVIFLSESDAAFAARI